MIRLAVEKDTNRLCEFDNIAAGLQERVDWLTEKIELRECFVIEKKNEVFGYGVFNYSFYRFGFIEMIYVDETYRKKGFGKEFLRYFVEICSAKKLFTSTNESNKITISLLESEGFTKSGVIHNLDDDDPELVYIKKI